MLFWLKTFQITKLEYSRLQLHKRLEHYESKPSIVITSDDDKSSEIEDAKFPPPLNRSRSVGGSLRRESNNSSFQYSYSNETPLVSTTCSVM